VFGLHHEVHAEVVEDLYRSIENTGYDLVLGASAPSRGERRATQSVLDYRCEALILVGPTLPRAAIEELAERLPVVVVARALRSRAVDVVRTDDVAGARLAVEHLAGLGHRSIAHVHGGRAPGAAERRRGYRTAMRELGLDAAREILGGLGEEDGERAAASLVGDTPETAVTAFNDHCAAGLLFELRARGARVPGGLSVVGYDDSHIAGLSSVALTTVAQDSAALASSALELAVTRVEAGTEGPLPTEVVVPPRLVVRTTTAPLD
jgi:DNA-binding LacI/PurR family transcriptional regulator